MCRSLNTYKQEHKRIRAGSFILPYGFRVASEGSSLDKSVIVIFRSRLHKFLEVDRTAGDPFAALVD